MNYHEALEALQPIINIELKESHQEPAFNFNIDNQYRLSLSPDPGNTLKLAIKLSTLNDDSINEDQQLALLQLSGALFPHTISHLEIDPLTNDLWLNAHIPLKNTDKETLHNHLTSFLNDADFYFEILKSSEKPSAFSPYAPLTHFKP